MEDSNQPKQWTECTFDERHHYLQQLTQLYISNNLPSARIDLHKQVGLNLSKGGERTSEEEFLFSENLFSVAKEDNVQRFNEQYRALKVKLSQVYDESTTVVMNESGYTVGDQFPDIRGLMHIKNELEQRVFKEAVGRKNIMMVIWSMQTKEVGKLLEYVDTLAHDKKVSAVYAVNADRIFLYNEAT